MPKPPENTKLGPFASFETLSLAPGAEAKTGGSCHFLFLSFPIVPIIENVRNLPTPTPSVSKIHFPESA
jgi:hypothetical protein